MKAYNFTVIFKPVEEGGYTAPRRTNQRKRGIIYSPSTLNISYKSRG